MNTTIERKKFPVTNWNQIHDYQNGSDTMAAQALSELCERYWYPLYAYARRCGQSPPNAEDLTQGFFEQLISNRYLENVNENDWRLRTFLLVAMKNYMRKQWRAERAAKRFPGRPILSIDQNAAEERYRLEPADRLTPDVVFERHWVTTLLKRVGDRLRDEYAARGKGDLCEALRGFLSLQKPDQPYAKIARRFGMKKNTVAVTACRMRERFRILLRQEVSATIGAREDVDEELAHLLEILSPV